ncbi:tetratricopeptide repeat protein [Tolypothrix sp. VBCCA 56010]|uniref:tetratricopeptide repeat protein n=1 Tax=Tolypothrix sp. VBCCA 56010 TaxID=3137731 RepID=UPI003D7E4361
MTINNQVARALSLVLLSASAATAQPSQIPTATPTLSAQEKLEISEQVDNEVDRAFGHTATLLNIMLVVLTLLPILAAAGLWLLRRSVISELVAETKKRLEEEVDAQLQKEVAIELQKQTEAFKQELEILKSDFVGQLSQLNNLFVDAQTQKEQIFQQLSALTPAPSLVVDYIHPEIQQKIQELTTQLEKLKGGNPQLFFTANDYLKQGDALFVEGRYDEAFASYNLVIEKQPEIYCAWVNRGWTLRKLGRYEEAVLSYDKGIEIRYDQYIAWFGRGNALRKLQRYNDAIASYNKTLELQPDFHWAYHHKARCHALQGNHDLALESLQQAINLKVDKHRELAKTNPDFDILRQDDRFQKLIKG